MSEPNKLSEQEVEALTNKMTQAVIATVEDCRKMMVERGDALGNGQAAIGLVILSTCNLMTAVLEAGVASAKRSGSAKKIAGYTREMFEEIVLPQLEALWEVTNDAGRPN